MRQPLFADLVFNEEGQRVKAVYVGGVPYYGVLEGDFVRHVEAEHVDRQIVAALQERMRGMSDLVTEGVIHMLGHEGLFTRASVEHAIENMDQMLEPGSVDVDELRTALWMAGFRAIVNVHGEVVGLDVPGAEDGEHEI